MKKMSVYTLRNIARISKLICVLLSFAVLYDIFRVKAVNYQRNDLLTIIWSLDLVADYFLNRYVCSRSHNNTIGMK